MKSRGGLRILFVSLLFAFLAISPARADARSFHAGITRIIVQDDEPLDTVIAYPTKDAEAPFQSGPYTITAGRDAPVAGGARFPVVIFSHGDGRRPGNPLIQRDLFLHLAREGFIVLVPFHSGARPPLVARPRQARKALDALLADPRFAPRADPARLGMLGFSFGGAVALISAGAIPNFAHWSAYCGNHSDDPRACGGVPTDGSWTKIPSRRSPDALPLKALVLLEPLGAPFDRGGLAAVNIPVLIFHALQSDLRNDGNALAIARALPRPPHQIAVPGGHFVFVDPCPPSAKARAPALCDDAPGIDRADIHRRMLRQISEFLQQNL